ncbi:anti-sigma factor family protein [Chelatococcus reniformis]|uniref:Membrane protein n=1 Tax=Chelatococcus reniformis TaxID=1494448 RepID=A0A916TYJ6_9HYPH|nr:anti-sigma factor [Chelatococcus reniformis]GGC50899.1 membrane protein [Chelatococcus reniformis]
MTAGEAPIGEDDLQAWIDGRLLGPRLAQVEAYLDEQGGVRERAATDRRLREALRTRLAARAAEPIPARLRIAHLRAARHAGRLRRLRAVAAAVGLFALGGAAGWGAAAWRGAPGGAPQPPSAAVARDAARAYRVFVVEVAHPVEVAASNEKHLLQWLSKRLGRPLAAPDLTRFGYRLMGGRLLPGGAGAAAQLMYEDGGGRRLTVYAQAAKGDETAFRFREEGGAATFVWIDQGFGFAVTASLDRDELLPIAEAIYKQGWPERARS